MSKEVSFLSSSSSMAVDLVGFSKMDDQLAIQEAASAGIKSTEHLINLLSHHNPHNTHLLNHLDCRQLTDFTVSKFKQVISLLNRTGHARFRRGPTPSSSSYSSPSPSSFWVPLQQPTQNSVRPVVDSHGQGSQSLTLDFAKPNPTPELKGESSATQYSKECFSISPPMSSTTSSFLSSITGDGSVSNGKQGSFFVAPAPSVSAGKPPLSSSHRKKCHDHALSAKISSSSSGGCHCSKRRYLKLAPF